MTAQISDTVEHMGKAYSLAGVTGGRLVEPTDYGLKPTPPHTACWRGFVSHYKAEAEFRLQDLVVYTKILYATEPEPAELRPGCTPLRAPRINRRTPEISGTTLRYRNLGLEVPITGGILLADGFIKDLYVHMGFHPAWKYERVLELILDRGHITRIKDCSAQMAMVRAKATERGLRPERFETMRDIYEWVQNCFELDYGRRNL